MSKSQPNILFDGFLSEDIEHDNYPGRARQVCMALPSIQEAAPATREESLYGTMEIITRH